MLFRSKDTAWHKYVHVDTIYEMQKTEDKPEGTSYVQHGAWPIFAKPDDINRLHEEESQKVRKWETTYTVTKILITHICPYQDPRFQGQTVSAYNIHLDKGYWIGSGVPISSVNFLGARLYSNPGRGTEARSRLFNV